MSRSTKRSITVPVPVREGLKLQIKEGIIEYPSENAAWIGLARSQLLVGKPHPVTAVIARMYPADQDVIDDFLLEIAAKRINLHGRLLAQVDQEAICRWSSPNGQTVEQILPQEILKLAREWRKHPKRVMARLAAEADGPIWIPAL